MSPQIFPAELSFFYNCSFLFLILWFFFFFTQLFLTEHAPSWFDSKITKQSGSSQKSLEPPGLPGSRTIPTKSL